MVLEEPSQLTREGCWFMGKFSRFNIPGHIHFVTTKAFHNRPLFRDRKCCDFLIDDMVYYRRALGFRIFGYCIMPNHLHALIWWDVDEYPLLTISRIIQSIKSHTAKEIVYYLKTGGRKPSLSPYSNTASEGSQLPAGYQWIDKGSVHTECVNKIWQKGFYDFNVYSNKKLEQKLNYIHDNPVRAGLVGKVVDYTYSSARNYIRGDHSVIAIDSVAL